MPRYAANLTMLWPELDVYDRFRAAAEAGFSRVEILFLHALDTSRVEQLLKDYRLEMIVFDPFPGDWDAGERGIAAISGREADFQRSIHDALETAQRLGVRKLNCLAGNSGAADGTLVKNLGWAAQLAESAGVKLLVENINPTDMPGYHVTSIKRAAEVAKAANHPAVRVQFDQYHVGMIDEDARALIRQYLDVVEHVQIADVPGRHEPGTGQQPITEFLADLDALGYSGSVGLEYRPSGSTAAALEWLPRSQRG